MQIHNKLSLLKFRRKLRARQTFSEEIFWQYVRNRKLNGLKFKRQHSIGNYIVDFYCASHRLIIELDGGIHSLKEQHEKDVLRDRNLTEMGFYVLRFRNDEVDKRIKDVLQKILKLVNSKHEP